MKRKNFIIKIAKKTIDIEISTLRKLHNGINGDFEAAVLSIAESQGRVVVTGIGKSAIIAQKIVATLNSTGTPALFMHAADAVHGDLGMIQPEDVVLCISKSGETAEIKVLLPLVKHLGSTLIGMVSNPNSYLGQQSDFVLHTPVSEEADPNNLAPTASTTAQIVMGDALAIALLALKGFSPMDFAQFHPGGTLGKQLYLRVSDIYPRNEKPMVFLDTDLQQTILEMTSKRLGAAIVVDDNEIVQGIITDGDLRRMLEKIHLNQWMHSKAADIMSKSPKTIEKDAMAIKALDIMRRFSITQLVVVEKGKYLGVVHLHDLVREGLI